MQARRAEQYLPQDGATLERGANPPSNLGAFAVPLLPIPLPRFPRFRFGVPRNCTAWHRRPCCDLRRAPCDYLSFTANRSAEDLFRASPRSSCADREGARVGQRDGLRVLRREEAFFYCCVNKEVIGACLP